MCIEFAGKEERGQKGSYEYKTQHKRRSARNTTRKTGREENIHIRRRNRQTDKEWAGGTPRLLLVKRQGWGFTLGWKAWEKKIGGLF